MQEIIGHLNDLVEYAEETQIDLENDNIRSACFRVGCIANQIKNLIYFIKLNEEEEQDNV